MVVARSALCWAFAFLIMAAAPSGALTSCSDGGDPEIVRRLPIPDAGSSGDGGTGGQDASLSDTGASGVGGTSLLDAPLVPVHAGVIPGPAVQADAGVSAVDLVLSHLRVLAAGSRGVTLRFGWHELVEPSGAARAEVWDTLSQIAELYREDEASVLLAIDIVSAQSDERPLALKGSAWNSPALAAALEVLIARAFSTFGKELTHLCIGNESDRFLAAASAAERTGFVELATQTLDRARQHPSRPPELAVGVGVSAEGVLSGAMDELAALIAASDALMVTYRPLDAAFRARPPSMLRSDLTKLVDALQEDGASPKPIVLRGVAYPSASQAGSSLEQQAAFYEALLQELLVRRESIPFVAIDGLDDPAPGDCEAQAAALGAAANPTLEMALCSTGLHDVAGEPKAAWDMVVELLATFQQP
jgi:hypothetical protein